VPKDPSVRAMIREMSHVEIVIPTGPAQALSIVLSMGAN
jgi:hypothetical protein